MKLLPDVDALWVSTAARFGMALAVEKTGNPFTPQRTTRSLSGNAQGLAVRVDSSWELVGHARASLTCFFARSRNPSPRRGSLRIARASGARAYQIESDAPQLTLALLTPQVRSALERLAVPELEVAYDEGELLLSYDGEPFSEDQLHGPLELLFALAHSPAPTVAEPAEARQAHLEQLGRALGFTHDELTANRQGRLHPAQLARGRKGVGGVLLGAILGALFCIAGFVLSNEIYPDFAALSGVDKNGALGLRGGGLLLGLACGAAAVAAWRKLVRRWRLYGRGSVLVATGPLRKVHVARRGGAPTDWRYVIDDTSFLVSRQAWPLATRGTRYHAYHLGGTLLALEPV